MNTSMRWVLGISLAVNFVLLGVFIGKELRHFPHHGHRDRGEMREAMEKLPEAKQKLVDDAMTQLRSFGEDHFKNLRGKREEMVTLLKAEPFDEAAFMAKAKELDDMHDAGKSRMLSTVAALAKQLTAEEREVLVEFVSRPPGKFGRRGFGRMGMGKMGPDGMMPPEGCPPPPHHGAGFGPPDGPPPGFPPPDGPPDDGPPDDGPEGEMPPQ